ncbi:MAG: hypothetical protein C4516_03450 [Oxalobacter sp.]|nr:MAG: hypothetical protein C4516_03450 [Oxalobacter sp.]
MAYQLNIKENAIDSFNEALEKYHIGASGNVRAYKFAILHMAHFLELVLKMYVQTLDLNLIYWTNFNQLQKEAERVPLDLLKCLLNKQEANYSFPLPQATQRPPRTITVDNALALAKLERCGVTGELFLDQEFIDDINWLKGIRNNIEHYQFELNPKDVRLCIGRIVRCAQEFCDIFSLLELAETISKENLELYRLLADEYEHRLHEAKLEVKEKEYLAFKGIRYKYYNFVDWRVYECPECNEETLIPEEESITGYRCTHCGNEESEDLDVDCDCCGAPAPQCEMEQFEVEDGSLEWRCYYCSGAYAADRDS